MIKVTHPTYKPQVIEEKWLDKFIANGWTVEGGNPAPKAAEIYEAEEPKRRGRPPKDK